jgi:hypothetical protein
MSNSLEICTSKKPLRSSLDAGQPKYQAFDHALEVPLEMHVAITNAVLWILVPAIQFRHAHCERFSVCHGLVGAVVAFRTPDVSELHKQQVRRLTSGTLC